MITARFTTASSAALLTGSAMTALGPLYIMADGDGVIVRLSFDPLPAADGTTESAALGRLAGEIAAAAAGDGELTLDVAPRVSPFVLDVLKAISRVERGKVVSYARLAEMAGHPSAVRAVATAVGRNPVPIVIPCHRIVPSACALNPAAALKNPALWGNYTPRRELKPRLLALEGFACQI